MWPLQVPLWKVLLGSGSFQGNLFLVIQMSKRGANFWWWLRSCASISHRVSVWINGFLRKNNGSTVPGQLIVLCRHCSSGTIVFFLKLNKSRGSDGEFGVSDGKRREIIVVSFWECGGSCDLSWGLWDVLMVAETGVKSSSVIDGCQGHSTLSSQRVFEGARLTQLVQLVTAGRLFPCHEGRVDP